MREALRICLRSAPGPRVVMDDDGTATVHVVGPMDGFFGFSAARMGAALDRHNPRRIILAVASPGGFVEEGLQVHADMRARAARGVTVEAEARGLVGSIAVAAFMGADTRRAAIGGRFMVHAARVLFAGNVSMPMVAALMRDIEAVTKPADDAQRRVWEAGGVSAATAKAWLSSDRDTWLDPAAARAAGLLTEGTEAGSGETVAGAEDVARAILAYRGG